ncbi:hypothetical protein X801_07574 [Opisthorchis viverrini]|uniref:Uncharacterized protein n=1 Tax=Opisthorchis viverrini TaxID=6198 RepID=A0A1S8WQ16_OPIVI|nr:hypothetical protein X801_07574 [Opisthorchis viverrini]
MSITVPTIPQWGVEHLNTQRNLCKALVTGGLSSSLIYSMPCDSSSKLREGSRPAACFLYSAIPE